MRWAAIAATAALGVAVMGTPAAAAPSAACTLTVGNVGYSAGMFYAGARLAGDCYGQVAVDLQLADTPAGPFTTVETTETYPLGSGAQGGTAWFTEAYNSYGCGFYYRAVGTYGGLTGTSPQAQEPC
ncbi:hypothetical protein WEI85_23220 [Actinomycetes bacterium KLBMP 9797]